MDPKTVNNMLSKVSLFREVKDKLRSMSLGVYNNMLRLYVKEVDGKNRYKLLFTMSIPGDKIRILLSEMENLEKRELKDGKYEFEIAVYGLKWDNNGKPIKNEKEYIGSFGIGKITNEQNEVINFIYVKTKADTKYVFPFLKTPYEEFFVNGVKLTNKTAISKLKLEGYRKLLGDIVASFIEVQTPNIDNNNTRKKSNKEEKSESETKPVTDAVTDNADIDELF